MTVVKYYFDYLSPYSYLAGTQLPKQDFEVEYVPISILDVMDAVHSQPSRKCPFLRGMRFLIMVRDTKYSDAFRGILTRERLGGMLSFYHRAATA